MRAIGTTALAIVALTAIGAGKRPESPLRLSFPLACHIGTDCAIQNYVDADPGPGAHDFLCRGRTYDGSDGIGFRLAGVDRVKEGVPVLASAAGRVARVRNGLPDPGGGRGATAAAGTDACGNGVTIDHGNGWQTEYCRLASGSIRVRQGQRVRSATPIGLVSMPSGTDFPHLHLTVRKDGRVVDPFAYGAAPGTCGGGRMLWRDRIAYQSGQVLVAGFAARPRSTADAQVRGADRRSAPTGGSAALFAFVQAIGLERGDVQTLSIVGPDARVLAATETAPLDHDEAQTIVDLGYDRPAGGWVPGVYQANYAVHRGGVDVILRTFQISM